MNFDASHCASSPPSPILHFVQVAEVAQTQRVRQTTKSFCLARCVCPYQTLQECSTILSACVAVVGDTLLCQFTMPLALLRLLKVTPCGLVQTSAQCPWLHTTSESTAYAPVPSSSDRYCGVATGSPSLHNCFIMPLSSLPSTSSQSSMITSSSVVEAASRVSACRFLSFVSPDSSSVDTDVVVLVNDDPIDMAPAHHAPTQRRTRLAWHFKRTHPNMARFGILAVLAAGLSRKSGGWIASCAGACVTPQTRAAWSDGVDLAHLALDVSHTLLHDAARCTEVTSLDPSTVQRQPRLGFRFKPTAN